MKLNINHAREFVKLLGATHLTPTGIETDGTFAFTIKRSDKDEKLILDPGIVAGLVQLSKSVERGQTPEDRLATEVTKIKAEFKL
jgi:hypothetical protein